MALEVVIQGNKAMINKRNEGLRERLDAVDESIMIALQEGPQNPGNLSSLAELNYHTCRQRLKKLLKYNYIVKPHYGEYALTDKGRRFVEELTLPISPDLMDPKLKRLIGLLPSELHRAFFRLLISGVIAKYHLSDIYNDGYPAFILGGETKSFKTALANVACRLLGLKPEKSVYPMFSAIAGEFGVRRFRTKGSKFTIAASPMFSQPFVCLDEFDKVTNRDTRRNVLFFLDGRGKFPVEGELVENRVCAMLTLNTKIGKEGIARFGIPEPYIRRSIVADTEHVRTELGDVDLIAKRIFEMKDFPKINLKKLNIAHTELPDEVFNRLRSLLLDCTEESFHRLVDTRPLVILTHGRMPLVDSDIKEAMYQTLVDRLVCLESVGGTLPGWREKVVKEWAKYKRKVQPEIEEQLREVEKQDKDRKLKLAKREADLEGKEVAQIDTKMDFIHNRAELSGQMKELIQKLGRDEPLVKPLRWLRDKVDSTRTQDQLEKYRKSFTGNLYPEIHSLLKYKYETKERIKQINDKARKDALLQKEREREEKRKKNEEISERREILKKLNHYLKREDLSEGEDPVLILQQLKVIVPVDRQILPSPSKEYARGQWIEESGKLKYIPPDHRFIDHGSEYTRVGSFVIFNVNKVYELSGEVQSWTSWDNVRHLLLAKKVKLLNEINRLTSSGDIVELPPKNVASSCS